MWTKLEDFWSLLTGSYVLTTPPMSRRTVGGPGRVPEGDTWTETIRNVWEGDRPVGTVCEE